MPLCDDVHSEVVARQTNDRTVSRCAQHVILNSATNVYHRRGKHVAGDFETKASGRAWHVILAQVVKRYHIAS